MVDSRANVTEQEALLFHSQGRPGKLEIRATKPLMTQRDLSLAYSPGAADRSYGIHVAKLAGLPEAVISRAEEVLATLEKGEQASALTGLAEDLPLFAARPAGPKTSPVEDALDRLDPDRLSPREALEELYRLRRIARGEE